MATVREEVVVDLKVQAKGLDNINTNITKTAESSKTLNASIGSVTASIGSFVGSIVKVSFALRLFNSININSLSLFGKTQKITKLFIKGQDVFVKKLTNITIPTIRQLGRTLISVGLALASVAIGFNLLSLALRSTAEGTDTLDTSMTTLDLVVTRTLEKLAKVGSLMGVVFINALKNITVLIPQLKKFTEELEEQKKIAGELTDINNAARRAQILRLEGTDERRKKMSQIQTALMLESLTMEEQIDLTRILGQLQSTEAASRIKEIELQVEALRFRQRRLTVVERNRRKLELEIQELLLKSNLARIKSEEILTRINVKILRIRDSWKEVDEAVVGRGEDPIFIDFDKEVEMLEKLLLEGYVPFVQGFEFLMRDRFNIVAATLNDIEDIEEEHIEVLNGLQEKRVRQNLAWEEIGVAGQLQLGAQLLNASAEIAQQNFELQKGFKIGEVVINTAAALVRLWTDPGASAAPFLTPVVIANGIAAIASIVAAQPGDVGNIVNPIRTTTAFRPSVTIESAQNTFFQQNQSQLEAARIVLVTEDLNTVQNRVQVTEDRASIG